MGHVRVRGTILEVEMRKYYIFWLLVCSLRYPTYNAHAPYCHLWPVPLYNTFPHYLINSTIFEKKKKKSYWTKNLRFYFLYKFVSNISHS